MTPGVLLQLFQGPHLPLPFEGTGAAFSLNTSQEELHGNFLQGILRDQRGCFVVDVSLTRYQGIQSACLMAWTHSEI